MKKIKAIIERASDGNFSVYMEEEMDYLVIGTGKTEEEARKDFLDAYEGMKEFYKTNGMEFEECEFEFKYDMASFLTHFSKVFSLAGLSRLTGINQGQLSHYVNGYRKPSGKTVSKMQQSIKQFAKELEGIQFV